MDYTTLVSAPQLMALMASKQPLRIFDCSFDLMQPHAGQAQYLDSHIPGAVYADL
ncbi:MAG: sulfurtransferase, partial [Polaromonas sp. 28-63-22]